MKKLKRISLLLAVVIATMASTPARPAWRMKADYVEACSCHLFCPCYFNKHAEHPTCEFNMAVKVKEGYSGKKNYVFSHARQPKSRKVEFINEDVSEFARGLRNTDGRHIWLVGGAQLIKAFLDCLYWCWHSIDLSKPKVESPFASLFAVLSRRSRGPALRYAIAG